MIPRSNDSASPKFAIFGQVVLNRVEDAPAFDRDGLGACLMLPCTGGNDIEVLQCALVTAECPHPCG